MKTPVCYCGSNTSLKSNSLIYNGKEYGNGKIWLCDRFPICRGSVGTHPDGRPLGTIPDEETKKLRRQIHALIDPLWKSRKYSRGGVYARISDAIGKTYHTGETTAEECREILKTIPLIFNL